MANVIEVQPHDNDRTRTRKIQCRLFLAGTIDMGNSVDWQHDFIEKLSGMENPYGYKGGFTPDEYVIYNPRRDKGFGDDKKEFEYQVKWELHHLEIADRIVMNILGDSMSPITLLELGLFARGVKLHVICEPTFYRYGNVKIVCEKYGIPLFDSMDEYLNAIDYKDEG